ncbi:acetate uptake transporter family protein ASCRUDRAFT_33141 [Ascoidea rubescens DSM 1968]|uniref:Uncharacterized protein n=1 Tax=Ascoidea rubescens DSM 1968 TaxID=1344418 RepID=A0A1D2VK19_9ASCO|nr:hypothetical protein ASCRUDRAFT_33141 [Ascoidea rubescens DSM 1968]ODV61971.1 hypothetical protein ASCRUDRAFT_33141 [Ascoidea rubescens DSM 1968]
MSKPLSKITTSYNGDIIHLGEQSFHREELMNAFGGFLNPGISHKSQNRIANPVPLGLATFSFCVLFISLVNAQVRGVTNVNIVIGASFFFGGVIELIAGVIALFLENTFAGVVLAGYAGFWLSYAPILTDSFGIRSSYETEEEFNNAMGFFLTGWMIFSFLLLLCTLKADWGFFLLFVFINLFVLMLTIGTFTGNVNVTKAGGYLGIIASCIGWYNMYSGIANDQNTYFHFKPIPMPHAPTI